MNFSRTITRAVIPTAGLGTRFLPASKTIPKEMFPVGNKPVLLHVIEEAVASGIEDIVLVQGRHKTSIEDFFDTSFELETQLVKTKKYELLEEIRRVKRLANIISIRQKEPLGLGHAILTADPVLGDEPFAVLLGDELTVAPNGGTTELYRL